MAVVMGIVFENESKNGYAAGEAVTGQVLLELLETIQVQRLRLQAHGGAYVNFTPGQVEAPHEGPSSGQFDEYLNEEVTLLTETPGEDENNTFSAGKHNIRFNFQVPLGHLVSTFSGKYGRVYYQVTAVLERASVPPQSVHRELRIINHIDVNSPALLTAVLRSKEETVGCWVFTSGPISLTAKIGRKGYSNGEAISIYADIENGSSRLVVPKAAIYQTQKFFINGKTKMYRQMLSSVRGNHIASGRTELWNGKTLKVPPVSPSILDCNIIRVEYSLEVYIHIPGAKKLKVELPLVIGTIPYNGFTYRNASVVSQFPVDMSWLAMTLSEQPEEDDPLIQQRPDTRLHMRASA
ncbi:arrestin domain-containing protein 4 isoform X2 [Spea bombifrons]|uniref:arrestin domain-containing protein 4 isoform X2 n=1 Tax=Spea bombifrons TaxID=233779 RepID=UPI00234BBE47|nr:arrestin domain-containing protein 4 isoform X2 [Spea bombifrons]